MTAVPDVLIVGAGLAGLMAAHSLQKAGLTSHSVDKGRSVGGRLATRRIGPGQADHGAQFFTVRSPEFQDYVDHWLRKGWVSVWSYGWSNGSLGDAPSETPSDGYPRYRATNGMNQLAKHLANGFNITTDWSAHAVQQSASGWQVTSVDGRQLTARALLLTAPVPQSLALLENGSTQLVPSDHAALHQITYAPCLCGLFWVKGLVHLPEPGALQTPHADITWVADNQQKGISTAATIITVHAGPKFSAEHYHAPEAEVLPKLFAALEPHLDPQTTLVEQQLKRWRYALPTTLHPQRTLLAEGLPRLAFAGDAFGGPRIEGAALSGLAAGAALINHLKQPTPETH